jgi:hypothetical protein
LCLVVEVRLGREEPEYIDLGKPGETDTGSVCDIVVRENIAIRSVTTRDPDFYPSRISDPGSNNSNKIKERGEKLVLLHFLWPQISQNGKLFYF